MDTSISGVDDLYHLKKIQFEGRETPIILQNLNGPCPLLAICNILLLQKKIFIHPDHSVVSLDQLMGLVGDYLMTSQPQVSEEMRMNVEQNISDALLTMPKMAVGLDVNVRFGGIDQFEFTSECLLFDVLHTRLVHGWLVDPQEEAAEVILNHDLSYNQLLDRVVDGHAAKTKEEKDITEGDKKKIKEGEIIDDFLKTASSQLTFYGLLKMYSDIQDKSFCVFFRNNHFSTLYKRDEQLYLLATDLGFQGKTDVVWEHLAEIDGDSVYMKADFTEYEHQETEQLTREQQEERDLQYALALSGEGGDFPVEAFSSSSSTPAPSSNPSPTSPSLMPDYLQPPTGVSPSPLGGQNRSNFT